MTDYQYYFLNNFYVNRLITTKISVIFKALKVIVFTNSEISIIKMTLKKLGFYHFRVQKGALLNFKINCQKQLNILTANLAAIIISGI